MEKINIRKIEVLPDGAVAIYPSTSKSDFEYVYRAGAGVYWDNTNQRFHHNFDGYDSRDISHSQWFKHITHVLSEEMGLDLIITNHTDWFNVTEEQKNQIITLKS